MSLLSIPSLVGKEIAVLFMPSQAVFIDLQDGNSILGYGTRGEDGLFYVKDRQDDVPKVKGKSPSMKAMLAIVKEHAQVETDSDGYLESDDSSVEDAKATNAKVDDDSRVWHHRLGHAKSIKEIKSLVRNGQLPHVVCARVDCSHCAKGKYRRQFKGSLTRETKIGRLHVDTKGKVDTVSTNGHPLFSDDHR